MKIYYVEGLEVKGNMKKMFTNRFCVRFKDSGDFKSISITDEVNHIMFLVPADPIKEIIESGDDNAKETTV